jgi:hypothetical protein
MILSGRRGRVPSDFKKAGVFMRQNRRMGASRALAAETSHCRYDFGNSRLFAGNSAAVVGHWWRGAGDRRAATGIAAGQRL